MLLAALLLAALPAQAPKTGVGVDPVREQRAAAAYQELVRGTDQKVPTDSAAMKDYFLALRKRLETFREEWKGCWASYTAAVAVAQIQRSIQEDPRAALATLQEAYRGARARSDAPPEGVRITRSRLGVEYGTALLQVGDFDAADRVLRVVAEGGGREAAFARLKLEQLPHLRAAQPGRPLPEFQATDLAGRPHRAADARGKVLLLFFWGTWSGASLAELPGLTELWKADRDRGLVILGVSLDKERSAAEVEAERKRGRLHPRPAFDAETLRAFLHAQGVDWPQIYEGKGFQSSLARLYAISSVPGNLLVDRQGVIRGRDLHDEELRAAIEELLAETDAPSDQ